MQKIEPKEELEKIDVLGINCPNCGNETESVIPFDKQRVDMSNMSGNSYLSALMQPHIAQLNSTSMFIAENCQCPKCENIYNIRIMFEQVNRC